MLVGILIKIFIRILKFNAVTKENIVYLIQVTEKHY